jgi:dTMP kinase
VLVAVEGIDGSGKGTITAGVAARVRSISPGLSVFVRSFPAYGESLYGGIVGKYLNGEFGELPAIARIPMYALDRFHFRTDLRWTQDMGLLLCDRYVPSGMAYSARDTESQEQLENLTELAFETEHRLLGMPIPDLIVVLDMPVHFASQNIAKKGARSYTDKVADKHERDLAGLSRVRNFYRNGLDAVYANTPAKIRVVSCCRGGDMVPVETLVDEVCDLIFSVGGADLSAKIRKIDND